MNPVSLTPANLFGLLPEVAAPLPKPRLENLLLVLAAVMACLGMWLHYSPEINQHLFLTVNHASSVLPENVRALLTVLGDGSIAACLTIGVFVRNPRALAMIFVAAIVAGLLIQIPKHLFDAARPPAVLALDTFSIVGNAYTSNSFPSGHSGSAVLAATAVALTVRANGVRALLLLLGALAALSRISVGVHWPADVLMGSAIGLLSGVYFYRCISKGATQLPWWGQLIVMLLLAVVSANGFLHDTDYEQFAGVTTLRLICAGIVAGVVLFMLAVLAWPLAEWATQRLFKESAGQSLARIFKFGMVGGSGFVVDMSLYALLHSWFGLHLLWARTIAYWLTSSWNWYLNRIFTFKDADNGRKRDQWAKYLIMCLISFGPSMGTFYGLTHSFEFFMHNSQLALMAGVVVGALFNYVVAGFLIFKVYGNKPVEINDR